MGDVYEAIMSYVRSSVLYAAEIWGLLCKNEYKVEKVHWAVIRSSLGVHSLFPMLHGLGIGSRVDACEMGSEN